MPISPTTYWTNQTVLSWWNHLWFLLRQLPKRNVRKVITKIVYFLFLFFCIFLSVCVLKWRGDCMPVKHCLLLLVDSALVVVTVSSYGNKIIKKGLKKNNSVVTDFYLSSWVSFHTFQRYRLLNLKSRTLLNITDCLFNRLVLICLI